MATSSFFKTPSLSLKGAEQFLEVMEQEPKKVNVPDYREVDDIETMERILKKAKESLNKK